MAAPAKKMVGVSDDSSSSDDEVLKRCQEAVWEIRTDKKKGESCSVMLVLRDKVDISVQIDSSTKYDISLVRRPLIMQTQR